MKKIGILTFHRAHNYGAVLQVYALQEHLIRKGFDVKIIDYAPKYVTASYEIFPKFRLPNGFFKSIAYILSYCLKAVLSFPVRYVRTKGFDKFINKKLLLTPKKYLTPFKENYDFDYYIIGSDQVWNFKLTKGFDSMFWGDFIISKDAEKITYAASMSNYNHTEWEQNMIKKILPNFNKISVREVLLKDCLCSVYNTESVHVLDPTLMVDISIWEKIAKKPKCEKYILVYDFYKNKSTKIVDNIKAKNSLNVIRIGLGGVRDLFDHKIKTITPEEYVGLFMHADYIVSTSFHGTAFSIIFNKRFFTLGTNEYIDSRTKSLLMYLGLEDRLIFNNDIGDISKNIDYASVNRRLDVLKKQSNNYMNNAIK